MTYDVYIIRETDDHDFTYELDKSFGDQEKAVQRLEKIKNKYKKAQVKVIPIPEIGVGSMLYIKGKYYGTIIRETNSFWVVVNEEKELTGNALKDENQFMKDNMEEKFIKGIFDPIEEGLVTEEEEDID